MILQFPTFGGGGLHLLNLRNSKNLPFPKRIPSSSTSSSSPVRCVAELTGNGLQLHEIGDILHNKVLVSAVVSAAVGQLTKPFACTILYGKKFDPLMVLSAGGFPSTHSSSVVATATCLAIERGLGDAIFGLAVVYAGLIMYDAQGVRREVGTHAKLLNKVVPSAISYPPSSNNEASDFLNSCSRESSSSDIEMCDPVVSEEHNSLQQKVTSSVLLEPEKRMRIRPSGVVSNINGVSETVVSSSLKESIGHTEVEVTAGALLGLVVSLVISPYL